MSQREYTTIIPLKRCSLCEGRNIPIDPAPRRWSNMIDLTGQRFTRLTAQHLFAIRNTKPSWCCLCDCGAQVLVDSSQLRNGGTKSCGCYMRETAKDLFTTHGQSHSPEYKSWSGMLQRCLNTNNPNYHQYGGRGITVCKRWQGSFENFYADMGNMPVKGMTIERRDNEGSYCPDNCYWATRQEQGDNRRTTVYLIHDGITLNMKQWSIKVGIPYDTIRSRLKNGWSTSRALTTPIAQRKGMNHGNSSF